MLSRIVRKHGFTVDEYFRCRCVNDTREYNNELNVGGCLKITTFRGTSMAKEAGYNEMNTLSGEKGGKQLPNEKALVQTPTHETFMKRTNTLRLALMDDRYINIHLTSEMCWKCGRGR